MPIDDATISVLSRGMAKNSTLISKISQLAVSTVAIMVAGAGIATAASGAIFTDVDSASMDVSSGWVDVTVGGSSLVSINGMKPGDVYFRSINVANTGSLPSMYSIISTRTTGAGAPLVDALLVLTKKTATAEECVAATFNNEASIGSEVSLSQLTITGRPLAAGASETLCFRISLPSSASNTVAGKNAAVTFNVSSEQQ